LTTMAWRSVKWMSTVMTGTGASPAHCTCGRAEGRTSNVEPASLFAARRPGGYPAAPYSKLCAGRGLRLSSSAGNHRGHFYRSSFCAVGSIAVLFCSEASHVPDNPEEPLVPAAGDSPSARLDVHIKLPPPLLPIHLHINAGPAPTDRSFCLATPGSNGFATPSANRTSHDLVRPLRTKCRT
jgi:hypothetical protein